MTTFLTVLFIFFLVALLALGLVFYRIYRWLTGVGKKMSGTSGGRRRNPYGNGGTRSRGRSRGRGRIIPPEYGEDVDYDVVELTGTETFVRVDDVLSGRGEAQVTDAEYTVIRPHPTKNANAGAVDFRGNSAS